MGTRHELLWRKPLVNDVAPVDVLVSDVDGALITFDMLQLAISWYVQLGALDEDYEVSERWTAHYRKTGLVGVPFTMFFWNQDMRPFRRDARFHDFITQLGYMEFWKQNAPPEGCSLRDSKVICN